MIVGDALVIFSQRLDGIPSALPPQLRKLSCLKGMFDLTTIFHGLQRQLFPALAAELGPLSALDQQFCEVISLTQGGGTAGGHA